MTLTLVRQFGSAPPLTRRWKDVAMPLVPSVGWDVDAGDGVFREVAGVKVAPLAVLVEFRQEAMSKLKQAEADGWRE